MPKSDEVFHVVARSYINRARRNARDSKRLITCAIYANNEPYLECPRGKKLGRREAQWICDLLNNALTPRTQLEKRGISRELVQV